MEGLEGLYGVITSFNNLVAGKVDGGGTAISNVILYGNGSTVESDGVDTLAGIYDSAFTRTLYLGIAQCHD